MKLIYYRDTEDKLWLTKVETSENETNIILPEYKEENGNKYTYSIGDGAFYGNFYVETIQLPMTLEKIGAYAFGRCYNLNRIICPAPIPPIMIYDTFKFLDQKITIECFKGTYSAYEKAVKRTEQGKIAFGSQPATSLIALEENDKVLETTDVPSLRFAGEELESIIITDKVSSIGKAAYMGAIELPSDTDVYDKTYFNIQGENGIYSASGAYSTQLLSSLGSQEGILATSSRSITTQTIEQSVRYNAFYKRNFNVNNNMLILNGKEIEALSFQNVPIIQKIKIGPNVINIAPNAFYNMPQLKNIELDDNNKNFHLICDNQGQGYILLDKNDTQIIWIADNWRAYTSDDIQNILWQYNKVEYLPPYFLSSQAVRSVLLSIPPNIKYIGYNALSSITGTVYVSKNTTVADGALANADIIYQ